MKKIKFTKVSFKIILAVTILITMFMGVASLIIYNTVYNKIYSLNKKTMKIVSSEIEENFSNLITIQTNDTAKISIDKEVESVIVSSNSLDSMNSPSFSADKLSLNDKLKRFSENGKYDENIFVVNNKGEVISSSNEDYINMDFSSFDHVSKALMGQDTMSQVYTSSVTSKAIVTFVKPVQNSQGVIIGAVGKSVYTEYFSNQFDKFEFLNDGYVFIVDNSANVVYSPVKYDINKKTTLPEVKSLVNNQSNFARKTIGDLTYEENSNTFNALYVSIPNLKCMLFLTVNSKEFIKDASQIELTIGILVMLLILILMPIIDFLIKIILRPMRALIQNTKEIASGNLNVLCKINSEDEIGQLSSSFNAMTLEVKALFINIAEVTQELMKLNEVILITEKNVAQGMNEISKESDNIINDTKNVKNAIAFSIELFDSIRFRIDKMKEHSEIMLSKTDNIMQINKKGIDTINDLQEANTKTKDKLEAVNASFDDLKTNINNIKEIAILVTAISKQTNILSLNASIEAAKAGSFGAGFQVVANEVKLLSDNITVEMNKIHQVIKKINENMYNTSSSLNEVNSVAENEKIVVGSTIESFNNIMKTVSEIVYSIEDVNHGIEELNNENNNVIKSIESVKASTLNFDSSIESVNNVIEEELKESEAMHSLVDNLTVISEKLSYGMNKFKV